jgi:hypothetical protein
MARAKKFRDPQSVTGSEVMLVMTQQEASAMASLLAQKNGTLDQSEEEFEGCDRALMALNAAGVR